jgi:hypothetical protein
VIAAVSQDLGLVVHVKTGMVPPHAAAVGGVRWCVTAVLPSLYTVDSSANQATNHDAAAGLLHTQAVSSLALPLPLPLLGATKGGQKKIKATAGSGHHCG